MSHFTLEEYVVALSDQLGLQCEVRVLEARSQTRDRIGVVIDGTEVWQFDDVPDFDSISDSFPVALRVQDGTRERRIALIRVLQSDGEAFEHVRTTVPTFQRRLEAAGQEVEAVGDVHIQARASIQRAVFEALPIEIGQIEAQLS